MNTYISIKHPKLTPSTLVSSLTISQHSCHCSSGCPQNPDSCTAVAIYYVKKYVQVVVPLFWIDYMNCKVYE